MALVHSDPFREVEQLFSLFNSGGGTRPLAMPMDAYRQGDRFVMEIDLPGLEPDKTHLTVEGDTLTITAERARRQPGEAAESAIAERPFGIFTRQIFLGENLDTEHIDANYEAGVLTVTIPIAEQAKPRRIEIQHRDEQRELVTAGADTG